MHVPYRRSGCLLLRWLAALRQPCGRPAHHLLYLRPVRPAIKPSLIQVVLHTVRACENVYRDGRRAAPLPGSAAPQCSSTGQIRRRRWRSCASAPRARPEPCAPGLAAPGPATPASAAQHAAATQLAHEAVLLEIRQALPCACGPEGYQPPLTRLASDV